MRTHLEILRDYLTLLNKENQLGYSVEEIETRIKDPNEASTLKQCLLDELYLTKKYKGRTVSSKRAFFIFCNVVMHTDIRSGRFIWNKFVKGLYDIVEFNQLTCIMAHRGSGKSFFFALYIIFKMYLVPYYDVCYCSNVPKQRKRFLRNIEAMIDNNELLLEKKDAKSIGMNRSPWGQEDMEYNSGVLEGTTVGTTPRGGHYNLAIGDDPLRDDQKYTYEFIVNYFQGVLKPTTYTKKARYIITGTPQDSDDLFHVLMNEKLDKNNLPLGKPVDGEVSAAGFYSKTFPAILDHKTKTVLIPEIWTYEELMLEKGRIGEHRFNREMMCHCTTFKNSLIGVALFRKCCDPTQTLIQKGEAGKKYVIFVDSATSDAPTADHFALSVFEDNETSGKFTLKQLFHKKGFPVTDPSGGDEDQTNLLFQAWQDFNNAQLVIEKNNAGIALIQSIQAMAIKRGKYVEPIEHYTHSASKIKKGKSDDIIDYFEHGLKAGIVVFPSNPDDNYTIDMLERIKSEHLNFGVKKGKSGEVWEALSGHDDIFDSCWGAFKFRSGNMDTIPFAITIPGGPDWQTQI